MAYEKQNFTPGQKLKASELNHMEEGIVNAVSVTEQPLSEEQKAQARENIGAENALNFAEYGLPILELTGDVSAMTKENEVSLGYVYGERNGTCTMKWQGSSSLNWAKKNYTIKFDNAFEAVEGWGEQKKYCLKANFIDHSHARNVVSAKLWGQIVKSRATANAKLNALPNGGAIDGFPIVIALNGEFHGLYTFNIPKDGWMFGMGSGTQEAIVCADGHYPATQFKATATLNGDFELEYVTDENNSGWVLTSLNRLINAVINSDGTDLDTTIAQYLDWDSAIDYYIFTVLIAGADMTDKNYILATYDGVKWFFSAYDIDSTYGIDWDGKRFFTASAGTTAAIYASLHRVMSLIKTYKQHLLKERYVELRESVMSENNVALAFENFTAPISSAIFAEDVKKWATIPSSAVSNINQIINWYRLRVQTIDAEFDEFKGRTNLFVYSTDITDWSQIAGNPYDPTSGAISFTEVKGAMVRADDGGGASCSMYNTLYENDGGTYTFASTHTTIAGDGVAAGRKLVRAYDADGNILNGTVSGWTYNSFYKGWFIDQQGEATFKLPANAASFHIGFAWLCSPAAAGTRIAISNIYLYSGV